MSTPEIMEPIDVLLVEDDPGDTLMIREAFEDNKVQQHARVRDRRRRGDAVPAQGRADTPTRRVPIWCCSTSTCRRWTAATSSSRSRATATCATIPVVVLTTSQAEEDVLRSYRLHANAYVTKPVDFDRFIEVVRQIDEFFVTVVKLPKG